MDVILCSSYPYVVFSAKAKKSANKGSELQEPACQTHINIPGAQPETF